MIKAGVIGHPIGHSKSPLIHGHWIQKYGLDGSYQAIDIAPENLRGEIERLTEEGYAGFNVTIPHKQSVMPLCDTLDDAARQIGAVNTVIIKDKKLHGLNTDAFGFTENLKDNLKIFDFTRRPAVVLGAGGAARAVIHALLCEDTPKIIITNRTQEKAEILKGMNPERIKIIPWDDREQALKTAGLLVNTTSLGMTGQPPLEMDLSAAPQDMAVCDIVYAPLMTGLLTQAKEKGLPGVTGIGMLLHQARPAFEAWFGVLPDVDNELKEKIGA